MGLGQIPTKVLRSQILGIENTHKEGAITFKSLSTIAAGKLIYFSALDSNGIHPTGTAASNVALLSANTMLMVNDFAVVSGNVGRAKRFALLTAQNTNSGAVGDPVYLSTAGGWSLTPGALAVRVGEVLVKSSTVGVVLPAPGCYASAGLGAGASGLLFQNVANSSALGPTCNSVPAAFDVTYTLPANLLTSGRRLVIAADGIATATHTTDTFLIQLLLGTTVIADSTAIDLANNDLFKINAEVVARAAPGAAVACESTSDITLQTTRTIAGASDNQATNGTLLVSVKLTTSADNAGNVAALRNLSVSLQ